MLTVENFSQRFLEITCEQLVPPMPNKRETTGSNRLHNTIPCLSVDVTLYLDASLQGWGAGMDDKSAGGMWLPTESENHINYLELLAPFFALQCFHSSLSGKHVKIMIDNTSAVSQISNMGT